MFIYKVAAYLRLSKDENSIEESNSIVNQKNIIKFYIKTKTDFKLIDYYIDDGYTGTNFNRPGFKKLLSDIKDKKINTIIVKDLSRFGRNYISVGNYIEDIFPILKVRSISINDNIDSENSSYYMEDTIQLKNVTNDFYSKDISRKVRSALKTKKLNGQFIGVSAPYGYLKDPNDKHKFIIDIAASRVVKKIFKMILLGKSKKEVAEKLNNKKELPPAVYKVQESLANNKIIDSMYKWNSEMINRILNNQTYTGDLVQGVKRKLNYRSNKLIDVDKEDWIITPNHHEALISKEQFQQVQEIIKKTGKINKNNEIDLFSGFLKCPDCDSSFVIKKSKDKIYYYCSNYNRNKNCTKHSINKNKLQELVLNEINKKYNNSFTLSRNILNELVDVIYIYENGDIETKFKTEI